MGYRSKDSYRGKTPEARERQLSGLRRGRAGKSAVKVKTPENDPFDPIYKNNIIGWLEKFYIIPETMKTVKIEKWQKKKVFNPLFNRVKHKKKGMIRKHNFALIMLPKKNGKSTLQSMMIAYLLFQDGPEAEIIVCSNSKDQSSWVVFDKVKRAIQRNENLQKHCEIREDFIENKRNKSIARVQSFSYKSAAGHNASAVFMEELWSYVDTAAMGAQKFYDEMMQVSPARKEPLHVIFSYPGFPDSSTVLYSLWERCVNEELDPNFYFYHTHENHASWVTDEYLENQKSRLRENVYLRLHECRWVSSESTFFEGDTWTKNINKDRGPIVPSPIIPLWVGIDASTVSDTTAIVGVTRDGDNLYLANHKIWRPTAGSPLDFNLVENYIKELNATFDLQVALYDPWQLESVGQRLRAIGIPMRAFNQTVPNLVEMAANLQRLLKQNEFTLYDDNELNKQARAAVGKETERGTRITKAGRVQKIDAIIALAMAVLGCRKAGEEEEEPEEVIGEISLAGASWIPNPAYTGQRKKEDVLKFEVVKSKYDGNGIYEEISRRDSGGKKT